MASPLLLSVKEATVRYSNEPVFEDLSFNIHERARIALVGRNGAGKSTLMNIITGAQELDAGERWEEAGVTIGYLRQDIVPRDGETVFEYIFTEIQGDERELHQYKVDMIAEALHLDVHAKMTHLSGGQLRRAGLARALVEEPDILLLDEPTNHLDLEAIEWLEGYLNGYRGTLLVVSHDRTFLGNITQQVFWLDRGRMRVSPRGFKHFEEWSTLLLEQEERELKNRKSTVMQEVAWASRGVKARVKRNVRRVALVKEMREKLKADETAYRKATAKVKLDAPAAMDHSSKIVAEYYNVHKNFGDLKILDGFNMRIKRGDRIGILGKNGSGKTTFLKMLLQEMEPDQGRVKVRKELEFSYFDQKRSDLNPEDSLQKVLAPSGGDYINVMGKDRHVYGYLKDFMFEPDRVQDKVKTLSGGQKNRLMLSKILANPKTCLILDEPTNDLDMDTLDMLQEILLQYEGTLIVVSHDRDFLDQTVTKILAFEGQGKIEQVIGGYSDYLAMKAGQDKPKAELIPSEAAVKTERVVKDTKVEEPSKPAAPKKKLDYKSERELSKLPDKIAKVEAQIVELSGRLSDGDFYAKDPDGFHAVTKELGEAQATLERYEARWIELEDMKAG